MGGGASQTGTILGHPLGLAYLAFTELWERFSYHAMTALLTLYMVKQLLLPGHVENVLGLDALCSLFEFRGPMWDLALASYGWYGGLVYFTPILGGRLPEAPNRRVRRRLQGAEVEQKTWFAMAQAAGQAIRSFGQCVWRLRQDSWTVTA